MLLMPLNGADAAKKTLGSHLGRALENRDNIVAHFCEVSHMKVKESLFGTPTSQVDRPRYESKNTQQRRTCLSKIGLANRRQHFLVQDKNHSVLFLVLIAPAMAYLY
jgi:ABC-type histidine transport system ATPase subunit